MRLLSRVLDGTRLALGLARIVLGVLVAATILFHVPGLSLAESDEVAPVPDSSVTEEA